MSTRQFELSQMGIPSEAEREAARESSRRLATHVDARSDLQVQIVEAKKRVGETLTIPAYALRLLLRILTEMAEGNEVRLIPLSAELTTQQAADLLKVSRPFLIGLLEDGRIPYRKVGAHRRILLQDVLEFKQKTDEQRLKALDELAAQAQELDMSY